MGMMWLVSLAVVAVALGSLLYAMSAECPPHAYYLSKWVLIDLDWRGRMKRAHKGNYFIHVHDKIYFACQLLVAATAGFIHAFIASLVPFVAEECGVQLHAIVTARRGRGGKPDYGKEGLPYAYQPLQWVKFVEGGPHVIFSGGSWYNHCRFACWASGQFLIGATAGLIHAFIPFLFPTLAEEVCLELGGLIISRRKLRNKSEGFKNPANLSDMLHGSDWKDKFEAAAKASEKDGDVGDGHGGTEIARGRVKVVGGPNQRARFL